MKTLYQRLYKDIRYLALALRLKFWMKGYTSASLSVTEDEHTAIQAYYFTENKIEVSVKSFDVISFNELKAVIGHEIGHSRQSISTRENADYEEDKYIRHMSELDADNYAVNELKFDKKLFIKALFKLIIEDSRDVSCINEEGFTHPSGVMRAKVLGLTAEETIAIMKEVL